MSKTTFTFTPSIRWPTFVSRLNWIDGESLASKIEPYRARIFTQALDTFDPPGSGRPRYNIILAGRGKKGWKSADLVVAAGYRLVIDSPEGYDSECYILANDQDQARDDLTLFKKLVKANPWLEDYLIVKKDEIKRKDDRGFLKILPAGDAIGQHGKSYSFVGYDEVHGYRDWSIFEAMQPDPHRIDSLQWITSYNTTFHQPGSPLYDLIAAGKKGTDPRMLFSWYAGDFTTDPDLADKTPLERANPGIDRWNLRPYLAEQERRLPSHIFRRLHLNLGGLPEGSAFSHEAITNAIDRGIKERPPVPGVKYVAACDPSGGSHDDMVLCIAHKDNGRAIIDLVRDQGKRPDFDPIKTVPRFVAILRRYGIKQVTGDHYSGEIFPATFKRFGIKYTLCDKTASELYESLEPHLNADLVRLLDVPKLEQQLLALIWKGQKIDHPASGYDDFANAAAGAIDQALRPRKKYRTTWGTESRRYDALGNDLPAAGQPDLDLPIPDGWDDLDMILGTEDASVALSHLSADRSDTWEEL